MSDAEEQARDVFLDHIRANMDSVREILQADANFVRRNAAENGMEMTPEECGHLLKLLRSGYDIVGDGRDPDELYEDVDELIDDELIDDDDDLLPS